LQEREEAGLRRYYELAAKHSLIERAREVETYSTVEQTRS
jgi:hypothetical protein